MANSACLAEAAGRGTARSERGSFRAQIGTGGNEERGAGGEGRGNDGGAVERGSDSSQGSGGGGG
eukprot:1396155-Rhodomonas_salina.1